MLLTCPSVNADNFLSLIKTLEVLLYNQLKIFYDEVYYFQ